MPEQSTIQSIKTVLHCLKGVLMQIGGETLFEELTL